MRTKVLLAILLLGITICLVGCSPGIPNKKTINNDIETEFNSIAKENEIIESMEIVERETDKDSGEDTILCKIISNDGSAQYTKYYKLEYRRIDKKWVMDEFNPSNKDKWSSVPLTGVKNDKKWLVGTTMMIEGEEWFLDETSIVNIKEISRDTQLEQKKDTVVFSLELTSDVLSAQGEVQANFIYDEGWKVKDISVVKEFETAYQTGKELIITEELLIDDLSKQSIEFGNKNQYTLQNIAIAKEEVLNFVIEDNVVSNMGRLQTCNCSFVLNKPIANFIVKAVVSYRYDNSSGWSVQEILYPECTVSELKLESVQGEWKGLMSEFDTTSLTMQSVILDIVEVSNEDGTFTATINIPQENRSCSLKGYVNIIDLSFSIKFEEWIKAPAKLAYIYKPELLGYIVANDVTLWCIDTTETNAFELQKSQ